jgi:hypothetical protein
MSVYSGPSPYAMDRRERELQAEYDEAREAFESQLEHDLPSLADWFGSSWVEYVPVLEVLRESRDAGSEKAAALLNLMAHDYANQRI